MKKDNTPTKTSSIKRKIEQLKKEKRHYEETIDENGKIICLAYYSKGGDPTLNLNGKVKDKNGQDIECRHLSFLAASKNLKNYHDLLNKKENIKKQKTLRDNDYDNIYAHNSSYYALLPLSRLQHQLYKMANALNSRR